MNEHTAKLQNNPKKLKAEARKALALAKEQERKLLANGAKWERVDSPVRTHILK